MDEEAYASCCFIVARTSKYVVIVFGRPKFALVRAPSLIERDDVPRCTLKFGQHFVDFVVGMQTARILV